MNSIPKPLRMCCGLLFYEMLRSRRSVGLLALLAWGMFGAAGVLAQAPSGDSSSPLSRKQQMIRDRFERFQDQLFRLREELSESEPENAARLGRALERSGELGLDDQLNNIVEMLNDPSLLTEASDIQLEWMQNADLLLNILLERDSDNDERRDEIDRLEDYKQKVSEMLQRQKALRDASAQAALSQRMIRQLEQAIQRVEAAQKRQGDISKQSAGPKAGAQKKDTADNQTDLSHETQQLSEDVKRLSKLKSGEESEDSPGMESARSKTAEAADSLEKSSKAMSQAGAAMKQSPDADSPGQQKNAEESLQAAKEKLEEARDALQKQADATKQAAAQDALAKKAGALLQQMKKDAAGEQGQPGQEGQQGQSGKSGKSSPGKKSVDKAKKSMDNASQSLKKDSPDKATPEQERAIDELEQAQQALEEELEALRKEERAEMLRDLEARFRDMLIKQRGVNESTAVLDAFGRDNFKRAERLQVVELATDQNKLADAAAMCLHILEEDATTVVFPRVMGQLGEDMTLVGKRLGDLKVGRLTQSIQGEIVETLEQLLEAVQKMQQENEQDGGKSGKGSDGKDKPLLPESAELKLLRASQFRVNLRTTAIADAVSDGRESERASHEGLDALAARQKECAEIAAEIRDKKRKP